MKKIHKYIKEPHYLLLKLFMMKKKDLTFTSKVCWSFRRTDSCSWRCMISWHSANCKDAYDQATTCGLSSVLYTVLFYQSINTELPSLQGNFPTLSTLTCIHLFTVFSKLRTIGGHGFILCVPSIYKAFSMRRAFKRMKKLRGKWEIALAI